MKPINFKYSNKTLQPGVVKYSKNVSGVFPLHIWTDGEQCVSCWHMTYRDRLNALIFGRVWVSTLTGATTPPLCVVAVKAYLC